jgi:hypothetical protein
VTSYKTDERWHHRKEIHEDGPERLKMPLRAGEHALNQSTWSLSNSLIVGMSSRRRCTEDQPPAAPEASPLSSTVLLQDELNEKRKPRPTLTSSDWTLCDAL